MLNCERNGILNYPLQKGVVKPRNILIINQIASTSAPSFSYRIQF